MAALISVARCKSSGTRFVKCDMPQRCKRSPDVMFAESEFVYLCYSNSFMSAGEVLDASFQFQNKLITLAQAIEIPSVLLSNRCAKVTVE